MRSKTSFFNFTLFKKTVIRFWPIWFLYAFIWIIALPLSIGSSISSALDYSEELYISNALLRCVNGYPLNMCSSGVLVMSLVFGLASAMAVFSHLYSARPTSAFASLPIRREGVFCSVVLAGLLPLLLVNLFIFLLTLLVELAFGYVLVWPLAVWLGMSSFQLVFFFGLATLCAQLTGSIIILPFVYGIFNILFVAVEYFVREVLNLFVYGYNAANFVTEYLSPLFAISNNCRVNELGQYVNATDFTGQRYTEYEILGYEYSGLGLVGIYAAVGLLLMALALLLYRKRRMETTGDVVAIEILKPVFKYCMTFGCALVLGLVLYSIVSQSGRLAAGPGSAAVFLFLALIGSIFGYFVAEMLLKKKLSVFRGRQHYIRIGLCFALMAALLMGAEYDLFGYERSLPETDEIEFVGLSYDRNFSLYEQENIEAVLALHSNLIEHKEAIEAHSGMTCTISYELKNGKSLTRMYELPISDEPDFPNDWLDYQNILNTKEAILARKATAYPITSENINYAQIGFAVPPTGESTDFDYEYISLTREEANELFHECILPDLMDGALGRIWLVTTQEYVDTVYSASISISCSEQTSDGTVSYMDFYTIPTIHSTRTNAWLTEYGITLYTEGETGFEPYLSGTNSVEKCPAAATVAVYTG